MLISISLVYSQYVFWEAFFFFIQGVSFRIIWLMSSWYRSKIWGPGSVEVSWISQGESGRDWEEAGAWRETRRNHEILLGVLSGSKWQEVTFLKVWFCCLERVRISGVFCLYVFVVIIVVFSPREGKKIKHFIYLFFWRQRKLNFSPSGLGFELYIEYIVINKNIFF